ncbi:MAG: hypothetical protein ACRD6X_15200, partial [Pyrinomonadaceae bacterium]
RPLFLGRRVSTSRKRFFNAITSRVGFRIRTLTRFFQFWIRLSDTPQLPRHARHRQSLEHLTRLTLELLVVLPRIPSFDINSSVMFL